MSTKKSKKGVRKYRKSEGYGKTKTKYPSKKYGNMLFETKKLTVERKNIDLNTTFAPPLTAAFATPQLLNGCPQGIGNNERIGRSMQIKSVQWRGIFSANAPACQHRVVIVYDKQANGAAPIATDVFSINEFTSPLQLANKDRFVIIDDQVTNSSQSSAINASDDSYKKCDLTTQFSGTGSTIASISTGSIYAFVANNADKTVGAVTTAWIHFRVRYTDV